MEATTQTEQAFKELDRIDYSKMELTEEVIQLNRVAKVVKGGRRFSFSALVVVGDKDGHVGLGFGKANEVPESIQKGMMDAKKNLIRVPRVGRTVPYQVIGAYSAARVLLKPASEGTGIIASAAVRSVLELGGIHDVLTKNLGSKNVINILKAVIQGLKSIRDAEEVMRLRGKNLEDIVGKGRAKALRQSTQLASAQDKKIAASSSKNAGSQPYSTDRPIVITEKEMSATPVPAETAAISEPVAPVVEPVAPPLEAEVPPAAPAPEA